MATGAWYEFDECEVKTTTGTATIPSGVWPVSEMSWVSITVNGSVFTLTVEEFSRLKLARIARKRP